MGDSKPGSSKSINLKRPAEREEPGQCSPPKQNKISFQSPDVSPPGSPRQKMDSVFANVCPKMSNEEIKALMYEEFLRLYHRKIIPASMLQEGAMMNLKTFMYITSIVMKKKDTQLREVYTSFLNEKLSEQLEKLSKQANEDLSKNFEDAGDPSYVA